MNFSIIIPTFQNYKYLSLCINSILKNSKFNHEIIVHINGADNDTKNFVSKNNLKFTESIENIGLCSGVNLAAKKASTNYILYAHDDMYFLPGWDYYLSNEIIKIKHNKFYLSLTQISHIGPVKGSIQHIQFNCGESIENFDESRLLNGFKKIDFKDLQGSHWAPHIIHKSLWDKIDGFSEEFNPGFASDPDLNMKLWNEGVRIFKNVSNSRVYHFGSLTTRKNIKIVRNNGKKTFLLKWGITIEFFVRYYLRRGTLYKSPLVGPKKNIFYYLNLLAIKMKLFIIKFFK